MNRIKKITLSLSFTVCFFISIKSNAQNWDIDLLRIINPHDPNSLVESFLLFGLVVVVQAIKKVIGI